MPTDTLEDIERVLAWPREIAPFMHEEAWTGSAGGCWKFWNAIWERRKLNPSSRLAEG